MEEVKISFMPTWDNRGTYYLGRFTITNKILKMFEEYLSKDKVVLEDTYAKFYATVPLRREGSYIFMSLTQTSSFIRFLQENKIRFKYNRANKESNYYLKVA